MNLRIVDRDHTRPAMEDHGLKIEVCTQDELTWIHDPVRINLTVGECADGLEAAVFLDVAHIQPECGVDFVGEEPGSVGRV